MNRAGVAKVAVLVVIAAAVAVYFLTARSQTPPPATTANSTPAATPSPPANATPPANPAPAASAPVTPAPAAPPPATAETPAAPPAAATPPAETPPAKADTPAATPVPPKAANADPFGEEQTLTPRKVVMLKGQANWDSAFDTLIGSLKTLATTIEKQGIKPSGNVMIVYNSTDDTGFTYQAEIPVDQDVKNLGKGMSMGSSPEGKILKFVHRGSYDNMDNTYEAITNHLDDKKLEAKDTFIEEYVTDPLTTAEDKLIINVYVPLK